MGEIELQTRRAHLEKMLATRKKQICDILKRLNAKSDDFFDVGEYVNELVSLAYELGAEERG